MALSYCKLLNLCHRQHIEISGDAITAFSGISHEHREFTPVLRKFRLIRGFLRGVSGFWPGLKAKPVLYNISTEVLLTSLGSKNAQLPKTPDG